METVVAQLPPWLADIFWQVRRYALDPWSLYQLGIILVCFVLALIISRRIEPGLEQWARGLKANAAVLRLVIAVFRRMEQVLLIAFLYVSRETLQAVTWPPRTM
ncbi:MAG: hypothetical protein AAFO77_03755 [Pseudomonadota bacterium]